MSGGIGVFVKKADKLGGTVKIFHNICPHITRGSHRGKEFAYFNDVQSDDIEVVTFEQELLAISNKSVVTPLLMEQMLALFAGDSSLDLVGSFVANAASTKTTQTQNSMYISFVLLPYVIG